MLKRTRLVDLMLRDRTKIVTVVAGAGAGKTTSLNQVPGAVLVSCNPAGSHESLQTRIDAALARPSDGRQSDRRLILDDVHLIGTDSPDWHVISSLIAAAPHTCSLILASRQRIPGLSARRVAGEVIEIGEAELCFTPAEAADIVGDPTTADAYGCWPALVALARELGDQAAHEYLVEEMLTDVPASTRELLTVAALTGGCSGLTMGQIVGRMVSNTDLQALSTIPLVRLDRDQIIAHPVWEMPLTSLLDPKQRRRMLTRVGTAVLADEPTRGSRLLAAATANPGDISKTIRTIARLGYSGISSHVLSEWTTIATGSGDEKDSAETLLLRGMLCRGADPLANEAVALLTRAADRFEATGCAEGQAMVLSELGFTHRMRGEPEAMARCLSQVLELADNTLDGPAAAPIRARAQLARAILADAEGDDRAVLRHVELVRKEALPAHYGCAVSLLAMHAAFQLGDPSAMATYAERYQQIAPAERWWAHHLPALVTWHCGRPLGVAEQMPTAAQRRVGNPVDLIWSGANWAIIAALRGQIHDATDSLAVAEAACPDRVLPRLRSLVASAQATVHAVSGDNDRARESIASLLESDGDIAVPPARSLHWCLAIAYVLEPDLRVAIDDAELGPTLAAKREAGRAIVTSRRGGRVPTSAEAWPGSEAVAAALPVDWAAELAASLTADGNDEGPRLATVLAQLHRERVRQPWRRSDNPGAEKLLRTVSIDPGPTIDIDLLGPTRLRIDGVETTHANWNRDRVRALLALVAHRRSISRSEAMATLWPDFDEAAGRRNLRVTLSHLQAVLEPDRANGEAPFYLRADGQRLALAPNPSILLDVARFEALLDRAEEAGDRGNGGLVVDLLTQATDLWRGDYLCDHRYEDWPRPTADRLRVRYVNALVRLGHEQLERDHFHAALCSAERALLSEPWSELAHEVAIDAHLRAGDRVSALRSLKSYEQMLDELGFGRSAAVNGLAVACQRAAG